MFNLMIDVHQAMIWMERSLNHIFTCILASQCSHQQFRFIFPCCPGIYEKGWETGKNILSWLRAGDALFACGYEHPPESWMLLSGRSEMACPDSTLKSYLSCLMPQSSFRTLGRPIVVTQGGFVAPDAPLLILSLQHGQRALIVDTREICSW